MDERILLAHGAGGAQSLKLLEDLIIPLLSQGKLEQKGDSATLDLAGKKLAFTTDSYVVKPLFFPGGDIGHLAVCGTINDLAMSGAKPLYISLGLIIEEGFRIEELNTILKSVRNTTSGAGVELVCGDTKVVNRGDADGIFINTAGIGLIPEGIELSTRKIKVGDTILLNGFIGDHGIAILRKREQMEFETKIKSDSAPLNGLVSEILNTGAEIHFMRDPTRGGVAAALNEISREAGVSIEIEEESLPLREEVRAICEIFGFEALTLANEGKLLLFCPQKDTQRVLEAMRNHPLGKEACCLGRVVEKDSAEVLLNTSIGGKRIVDMPRGELIPRIC